MTRTATPNRGKIMSDAEFKRLWLDATLSLQAIGDMLGITLQAVSKRARKRGLPPRGQGRRPERRDRDLMVAMWRANVGLQALADHFGTSTSGIDGWFRAKGWKRHCNRMNSLTVTDFYALQLAARMTQAAAVTKAAMRDAEMLDKVSGRPRKVAA